MFNSMLAPEFIFESSWEVCNKVGGIYTVLSTRAKTLQDAMPDKVVFIGPDFWQGKANPLFKEDRKMWTDWKRSAEFEGLKVRVGRWNIPGNPCVILVDFNQYFAIKNDIYAAAWNFYQVDSLHAYGDYDEANMFSYAAARVVESYYHFFLQKNYKHVIYQAHEWMTCLGALYLQTYVPQIATIFTTHATSIGRSIAGNHKPLYDYLWAYNGTQMANELNIESKHSIEKQTAHHVDCFTTVSEVTGKECEELLDKKCDAILMNGFEADFVPVGASFASKRKAARKRIFQVANALTGATFADDTIIVATSGRYEFKNKGIDVFVEAMLQANECKKLKRQVLALIQVPAWVYAPREDLKERLSEKKVYDTPLFDPIVTHCLHDSSNDPILKRLHECGFRNEMEDRVKIVFVPCYLDGNDGIFDKPYYDMLIGDDLAVYPSYYEPWGYTPLEAVAFHVPCVTTSLSGFGMWANQVKGAPSKLLDGVEVIERNDYNTHEVIDAMVQTLLSFAASDKKQVDAMRRRAGKLSEKALWKHFISYYYEAYDIALHKMQERNTKNS